MRADLALVEVGLCTSRAQARQRIEAGEVFLQIGGQDEPVRKASQKIGMPDQLALRRTGPVFVSRGGIKLDHALHTIGLKIEGRRCVDFGQSTGGFTDCLIQRGAQSVVGFDVGHGQLHPSLRDHDRVTVFEGVNLKEADARHWLGEVARLRPEGLPFELAVADLSFISLARVCPALLKFLTVPADCLFLVKPQFELGKSHLGKNGLVKDIAAKESLVQSSIESTLQSLGCEPKQFFPCEITGGDGNQEYFIHARWPGPAIIN